MARLVVAEVPESTGTRYPAEYAGPCLGRAWKPLGALAGLTQFGVNLVRLEPGVWLSQRHWHSAEDEYVHVLEGEVVLVDDAGEHTMRPGECAGFPSGVQDGHCFQNRSMGTVLLLVVGTRRDEDRGEYPDIDMQFLPGRYSGGGGFARKDGTKF